MSNFGSIENAGEASAITGQRGFGCGESDILEIARAWIAAGHQVALGTVIRTSGSAPRQPGALVAVCDNGAFAGSVSAGCVEGAVIEESLAAIADGRHRILSFGVADDGSFAVGLMCGGKIDVLIERAEPATLDALAARGERVMVRAVAIDSGESRVIEAAGDASPLGIAAAQAARGGRSGMTSVEGQDWFLSVHGPAPELVIVGAVHIAQALCGLAAAAGYRVRVIDPRAAYATPERFAGVTLVKAWPDEALAAQPLTRDSALVVLAHDPKLDDAALAAALRGPCGYIGALGSARTQERRRARLAALGFAADELARIHGPVGLAIGARAPMEIAIAILAELVQQRRAAPRLGAVIPAAGLSRRMGRNKLVLPLGGKPLVRHAVDAALAAGADPVIVVTGHDGAAVRGALAGAPVTFVRNDQYAEGIASSLRAGIAALPPDCAGALVLLGDMPGVTADLAGRLMRAFDPATGRGIVVATAHGERGHPVLWGRQFFAEIMALSGDRGARGLMAAHASQVCEVEAGDDAPLTDIDTPEALAGA